MKTEQTLQFDAVVIGSGITGLAMALSLAECGNKVAIVDQALSPPSLDESHEYDARIYALNENSVTLLKKIDVWKYCDLKRIQPITAMKVFGDKTGQLDFNAKDKSIENDSLGVIIESKQLIQALYKKTSHHPYVKHLFGLSITSTDLVERLRVVTLSNGMQLYCQLLVASDGLFSPTRSMMGIEETITEYEHSALVANYQSDQDHDGIAKQWFLSNGDIVALLPLPNKVISLVWSTQHDNAHYLSGIDPDKRIREIHNRVGYGIGHIKEMTKPHVFPLRLIRVNSVFLDRFVLCGDAAHGVHPMAGQGLNLGLADVSAFIELLSSKTTPIDIGEYSLLSSYARRRVESVALMQGLTHSLYVGFRINTPWISWVRNTGMNIINGLPGLKKILLKQAGHA